MARPSKLGLYPSESTGDVLADFMARVMCEPMSGCWLWIGDATARGYGRFRRALAHRASFELFKGRIPDGLVVDHKCKTLCCVNPAHLEAVSQGENVRRGDAAKKKKDFCKNGHQLTQRRTGVGQRICLECSREAGRRYRAKQRQQ